MRLDGKGLGWVILRQGAGYVCLVAGVLGCILPIIPGIPLLFAGLGFLAVDSPWAARLLNWLKEKAGRQWAKYRKKSGAREEVKIPE
jgi:uncharacterized membrane protein YbaN (DUF454 family)